MRVYDAAEAEDVPTWLNQDPGWTPQWLRMLVPASVTPTKCTYDGQTNSSKRLNYNVYLKMKSRTKQVCSPAFCGLRDRVLALERYGSE